MSTISARFSVRGVSVSLVWLPLLMFCSLAASRNEKAYSLRHDANRLQNIVDELKAQLGLANVEVTVRVVASNPLMVSVGPSEGKPGAFDLQFEDGFLDGVADDELKAIAAHELGHVWIFTHHPYLQTERGANEVAMRAVTRQVLERVYAKVWARGGTKGDLVQFLGTQ